MSLLLPEHVAEDIERAQQVDRELGAAEWLDRELRAKDPQLCLCRAHDNADDERLVPGYWHVKRRNDGIPDFYMPITGPNGEYREPDARVLEELDRRDLWRGGRDAVAELRDRRMKEAAARERARLLMREQEADVLAMDIAAAKRVFGDGGLERRRMGRG